MPPDPAPRRPKPRFSLTASVVRGPQAQSSTSWGSAAPRTGRPEQSNAKRRRLEDGHNHRHEERTGRAWTDVSPDAGPSRLPPPSKGTSRQGVAPTGHLSSTFENGSRLPSSSLPPSPHVPRPGGKQGREWRDERDERRARGQWSRPPTEELMNPRGWRLRVDSPPSGEEDAWAEDGGVDGEGVEEERRESEARSPSIEFMGISAPHPEPPPVEERSLPRQSLLQSPATRSSERRSLPQSSPASQSQPRPSLPRSPPPMSPGPGRDELHSDRARYDDRDAPFHSRDRLDRVRRDVAWILQPPASPSAPAPPFQPGFPSPFPQPARPQANAIWPPPAVPNAIYKHPAVYPDYPQAPYWGGWDGRDNPPSFPMHHHRQPLWPNQSGFPMPPPPHGRSRQRQPPTPAEYRSPGPRLADYVPAHPPPPRRLSPTAPAAAPRRPIRIPTANGYQSPPPAPPAAPPANPAQDPELPSPPHRSQSSAPPLTPSLSLPNSLPPVEPLADSPPAASASPTRAPSPALAPASPPPPPSTRTKSGARKTRSYVRKPPTPAWDLDASDSDGESHFAPAHPSVDPVSAQDDDIQIIEPEETGAASPLLPASSPRTRSTRTHAAQVPGDRPPVAAGTDKTLRKRPRAREPPISARDLDASEPEELNKRPKRRTRPPSSPPPARRSLPKRAARPSSNVLREEPSFRDADLDAGDDTYKPKGSAARRLRPAGGGEVTARSTHDSSAPPSPSMVPADSEDDTGAVDPISDASRLSRRRIPSSPLSSAPDDTGHGDDRDGNIEADDSASSLSLRFSEGSSASSHPPRQSKQSRRHPSASPSRPPRSSTLSAPQPNPPLPAGPSAASVAAQPPIALSTPAVTESAESARPIAPRLARPLAVRPNTSAAAGNARPTVGSPTSNILTSCYNPKAHWDVPSVAEGANKSLKPVWKLHQPRPEAVHAKKAAAARAGQQGVAEDSSAEVVDLTSPDRDSGGAAAPTTPGSGSSRRSASTSTSHPPPRATTTQSSHPSPAPAPLPKQPALSHPDVFKDLTFAFVGETFLDKFLGPLSQAIELRQGRVYPIKAILEDSRVKVDYLLFPHPNQARYGINAKLDRIDAHIVNGHHFNWARCALVDDRWVFKAITTGTLPPALDAASITALLAAHKVRETIKPGEERYVELVIAELRKFGWRNKARTDFFQHFKKQYPTKMPPIELMAARYSGMLEDACPAFARAPVSREGLETPREPSLEDDGIEILNGPVSQPPPVGNAPDTQTRPPGDGMIVDLTIEAEGATTDAPERTQPDPAPASSAVGGLVTCREVQADEPAERPLEPAELLVAPEDTPLNPEEPPIVFSAAPEDALPEERVSQHEVQPEVRDGSPGPERLRALSMGTEESAVSRVMDVSIDSPAAAAASLEGTSSPSTVPAPPVEVVAHSLPNLPGRVLPVDEECAALSSESVPNTITGSEDCADAQPPLEAPATANAPATADTAGTTSAPAAKSAPGPAASTAESSPYANFIMGLRAAAAFDSSPYAARLLVPSGQAQANVSTPAVNPPVDARKSDDMNAERQLSTIVDRSAPHQATRRLPSAQEGLSRGPASPMLRCEPQRAPIKFLAIAPRPAPQGRDSDPGPGPATGEAVAASSEQEPSALQADTAPHWGLDQTRPPRPVVYSSIEEYTEALAREEEGKEAIAAAQQRREQELADACAQLLAREREKEMERWTKFRRPRKLKTATPQPSAPARPASAPAEGLERDASTVHSVTPNDVSAATLGAGPTTAVAERPPTPTTPPPPMPAGVHLVTDREGDVSREQRVRDRKRRRDRVRAKTAAKRGDGIPDWGDYDYSEPESEEE